MPPCSRVKRVGPSSASLRGCIAVPSPARDGGRPCHVDAASSGTPYFWPFSGLWAPHLLPAEVYCQLPLLALLHAAPSPVWR